MIHRFSTSFVLALLSCFLQTDAFTVGLPTLRFASSHAPTSSLAMESKGMGMASSSKKKGAKAKKGVGSKGKPSKSKNFDVSASLLRLDKRYDELMLAFNKKLHHQNEEEEKEEDPWATTDSTTTSSKTADVVDDDKRTSEFVVAARASTKQGVNDWVPIAQLCLSRPENDYETSSEIAQLAISLYCRELSHVAAKGAPIFSTVARNDLQYSIEPIESFHKYVYDDVIEGGQPHDDNMSKAEARKMLGLLDSNTHDKITVKQAYRKLSFELHPDRVLEGRSATAEESKEAADRFGRVKKAYDTLSSGVREDGASWYESLGGRARTDFKGPINLLPLDAAQEQLTRKGAEAALVGLDPSLTQSFVARNLRSE